VALPSRYQLGPRIGQGGTADVFRARAKGEDGFTRTVVIKRIRADLESSPEVTAMFDAEAQLAQRLRHGGIAQLLDHGMDGAPYLVLEYVDGVSLDALLAHLRATGGALALADALYVVEQVAEALAYAHRLRGDDGVPLGLVHRDVNPRNILLSGEGVVKLTDFGIARIARRPPAHTMPGVVKGSLGYMAPEQMRGAPVDARTDQFALGVVLHELVSGDNPLGDAETLREAIEVIARGLPPLDDAELGAIVARATAEEPAARFASMNDLIAALEEWRVAWRIRLAPESLAAAVRRARGDRASAEVRRLDDGLALAPRATVAAAARPRLAAPGRRRARLVAGGAAVAVGGLAIAVWLAARPRGGGGEVRPAAAPAAAPAPAVDAGESIAAAPPDAAAVTPDVAPPRRHAPRAEGRLKVNVLPWAKVTVDGRAVGTTPVDVKVGAGDHQVVLFNPGSKRRAEHRVKVEPGGTAEITRW